MEHIRLQFINSTTVPPKATDKTGMFTQMLNWCRTEPSRKLILLTFIFGITSVLVALVFATMVLGATSRSLGDSAIPLSTLFFMGFASQWLFKIGPVLLMISLGVSVSRKIPFLNRRKPKAPKGREVSEEDAKTSSPENA